MVICCQDCGIIIYWDDHMKEPVEHVDDISCPPYITMSGDLFCVRCGQKYDEAEEEDEYGEKYDDFYDNEPEKKASEIVADKKSIVDEKREKP